MCVTLVAGWGGGQFCGPGDPTMSLRTHGRPPLFLSNPRAPQVHQRTQGPDRRVGRRGLLRVPGHGRPQAPSDLEQEGQEGELAALRGEPAGRGPAQPMVTCSVAGTAWRRKTPRLLGVGRQEEPETRTHAWCPAPGREAEAGHLLRSCLRIKNQKGLRCSSPRARGLIPSTKN